ncbi:SIS domain-containing protein [Streptomyces avermitilis]
MSTDDRVAVTPGIARPHASPGLAGPGRLGLVNVRPAAPGLVGDGDVYDVCVGVSPSGTTPETVRALGPAHRPRRAIAAALTDAAPCPVADAADAALGTVVRETGLRQGAISVRIAQLAVVDRVLIAVTRRTPHQT